LTANRKWKWMERDGFHLFFQVLSRSLSVAVHNIEILSFCGSERNAARDDRETERRGRKSCFKSLEPTPQMFCEETGGRLVTKMTHR
jgi:hypothetical protein